MSTFIHHKLTAANVREQKCRAASVFDVSRKYVLRLRSLSNSIPQWGKSLLELQGVSKRGSMLLHGSIQNGVSSWAGSGFGPPCCSAASDVGAKPTWPGPFRPDVLMGKLSVCMVCMFACLSWQTYVSLSLNNVFQNIVRSWEMFKNALSPFFVFFHL